VAVATAKRIDFAQEMLGTLGVAHFFDEINGASVDLRITSKFDIMSQVIEHWSIVAEPDIWMVGDRHFDMVAARAHGVSAVGVLWGFGSDAELLSAGAHWTISRPSQLVEDDEGNGGSTVCMLDEVCANCGQVVDAPHTTCEDVATRE
jgi:phosphoglycolate phosphatase